MALEKSQIKFAKSEETGEVIGFVSRHSKTKKLKGVREDSRFGKKICVLSEELKGTIIPNLLYSVELKEMRQGNGYVVVSATPILFTPTIETIIIPKTIYQVKVVFGNKTVYFDPKEGRTDSSKTICGVVKLLKARKDIDQIEAVIEKFVEAAYKVLDAMSKDGFVINQQLDLFPICKHRPEV